MAPPIIDLNGQVYGRLTVLNQAGRRNGTVLWLCQCSCGNTKAVRATDLRRTRRTATRSCGCLAAEMAHERSTTHGQRKHELYGIWKEMLSRCEATNNKWYSSYGGRGITVCERWHDVRLFIQDMGERPSGYMLDRRDNDKGYSPENCRWATPSEQALNTRRSLPWATINGRTQAVIHWCRELGLNYHTIKCRIRKQGRTPEDAILNNKKTAESTEE